MNDRGTGMTTRQIQSAPQGALYIWVDRRSLNYANALAHHLGRTDLEIHGKQVLDGDGRGVRGRRFPAIVVDHACELSTRQYDVLHELRKACPPRTVIAARVITPSTPQAPLSPDNQAHSTSS